MKGEGVDLLATRVFPSSSAKRKCPSKKGTVIIATVRSGKVVQGELLEITSFDPESPGLKDTVIRIEKNHQPCEYACPGDQVGICLQNTSCKKILPLLGKQSL